MTERASIFGIQWREPDRLEHVTLYMSRSMLKLRIAEWHRTEFERLEDEHTTADFFRFDEDPFVKSESHADGCLIQLAAAFDTFACAIAYNCDLPKADKASFRRDYPHLGARVGEGLGPLIRMVGEDTLSEGLAFYRNLSAHRGVLGEVQRGGSRDDGREYVRLLLPSWLPEDAPDYPEASVRVILERYISWAKPKLELLHETARGEWELEEEPEAELLEDASGPDNDEQYSREEEGSQMTVPTEEESAPIFGEWHAWYSNGSYNFVTESVSPPAWYLRRGTDEVLRKNAAGLEVEELKGWLEQLAGSETAKAVLWHYRPRELYGTRFGRLLIPALRR